MVGINSAVGECLCGKKQQNAKTEKLHRLNVTTLFECLIRSYKGVFLSAAS